MCVYTYIHVGIYNICVRLYVCSYIYTHREMTLDPNVLHSIYYSYCACVCVYVYIYINI